MDDALFFCLAINAAAQEKETQHTSDDLSPVARTESGDVGITFERLPEAQREPLFKELNNSRKVINRPLKELDQRDIAVEDRQAKIDQWIKKYNALEQQLKQS